MHRIIILGAGYAGLMTALRLQQGIRRHQIQVTLINARDTFVERIRLHQQAAGQRQSTLSLRDFLRGTGICFVQDAVQAIDPQSNTVHTRQQRLNYDTLVIATGSSVDTDAMPGIREHAHTLDAGSVAALRQRLTHGGRVLIAGGGLTGIEAAAEFAGLLDGDVHLISTGAIGNGLSDTGREYVTGTLRDNHVILHPHTTVTAFRGGYVETHAGLLDFDVCLWAGGFRASPLMKRAGLTVNERGQMRLRETLQSVDYDNIFGAGDAGLVMMQGGTSLQMACATAMPMGVHAADNILCTLDGNTPGAFEFGSLMVCISLGRRAGLVQFTHADGTPTQRILTGRTGAVVKELVSRYTVFALRLEKYLPGSYRYPKGHTAIAPPVTTQQEKVCSL